MSDHYRKHFFPLESSPEVFTELTHQLGGSQSLRFHDVLFVDQPEALILILPTSAAYEAYRKEEDAKLESFGSRLCEAPVVWFKQTINNACGLYSILHAVCNGAAAEHIRMVAFDDGHDSVLGRLLEDCQTKQPDECARAVEDSEDIESAYQIASALGQSEAPTNAEEEVDFHYISLVCSGGRLYELDGDRKGPIDRGPWSTDVPYKSALRLVQQYIDMDKDDIRFSLMALVRQDQRPAWP